MTVFDLRTGATLGRPTATLRDASIDAACAAPFTGGVYAVSRPGGWWALADRDAPGARPVWVG